MLWMFYLSKEKTKSMSLIDLLDILVCILESISIDFIEELLRSDNCNMILVTIIISTNIHISSYWNIHFQF